ncbi:Protein neprosin [Cardamine amara subsp. amara]|uniref:Protein neprosin n=1 Tax=Cardamine amara subsp. amara TaxID=228776 RepID=A0ABD1C2T8_CARAN
MASPWVLLLIFSLSLLCLRGWSQNTKPDQDLEYECVDIDKQPSLQHPQLKNHQIQMRPSDELLAMLSREALSQNLSNADEALVEFDIPEEGCPQGQVPIHKPRRLNHSENSFHPNGETLVQHFAMIKKIDDNPWRGTTAVVGINQPQVINNDQFSLALMMLTTKYDGESTTAWFDWAVFPEIYGDTRTRLTAYWTPDTDVNGCYNVRCKGFVQINKRIFLGAPFAKISVKGGQQYSAFFSITQDPKTNNFLVTVGNNYIGYWPEEILPLFNDGGAEMVRFGGVTNTRSDGLQSYEIISPQMGNGNKPLEDEVDLKHTSFMHSIKYVTQDYQIVDIDDNNFTEDADAGKCFDVSYLGKFGRFGKSFTFGGPGGLCDV